MEALLGLFLFSVFIRTVVPLQCETCMSLGRSCTGSQRTCLADQDTCVVTLTESTVGGHTNYIAVKGCYRSSICKQEPIVLNFGQGRNQRNGLSCCMGNECDSVLPQLPPFNTTANGKQCPACFSTTGSCPAEIAQCTGFDDYCFHTVVPVVNGLEVTTKGCVRKSPCDRLKAAEGVPGEMLEVDCQPARSSSPSSGSIFLDLFRLLSTFH